MLDQKVLDAISAECMEQFQQIQQSCVTNMVSRLGVAEAADAQGFCALVLVAADKELYRLLLKNFGELTEHYGITQEVRSD